MDGIINIYKPLGITSHAVVAKVRRILNIKKVGHTGTLDPQAEGVLPICIGKGTKASDMLIHCDKQYRTVLKLGVTTDTQDATGIILKEQEVFYSKEQLFEVINRFKGDILQIPPMHSAIKVQGKKLYELARKGIEIERTPRKVTISKLSVDCINQDEITLTVDCSKGTYIRTLCHDIGEALGCGGIMKSLVRTRVGSFRVENAVSLEQLEQQGASRFLIPLNKLFDSYQPIVLTKPQEIKVRNGVRINMQIPDGTYRLLSSEGELLCISKAESGVLKMQKAFYGG